MPNIQIKRYTGSAWENVNPRTLAQNIFDAAGSTAIFDGSDKIKIGYLPDAVFDSLLFTGVVSNVAASSVALALEGGINTAQSGNRSPIGVYFVMSVAGTISQQTSSIQTTLGDNEYYQWTFKNNDAGGTSVTSSGPLEIGDWVVITGITGAGTSGSPWVIELAVISNVYEDATTAVKGIVQLSDATTYASLSGNHVVTEGVLKTTIDNASFASSSHTHLLAAGATDVTATASEVNILDGATITTAELNYLDGVTSAIQTQLNGKASTSHTHTVANITDLTATASEINVLDGITSTTAELNKLDGFTGDVNDLNYAKDLRATGVTSTEFDYLDGVTSNIQTQLNGKQATITGAATSIVSSNLTASRAVVSDGSGKVAVSSVTSTELGYLSGVTSAIQTQLNGLAGRVRVYYDGTPSGMVADDIWFDAV